MDSNLDCKLIDVIAEGLPIERGQAVVDRYDDARQSRDGACGGCRMKPMGIRSEVDADTGSVDIAMLG